VCNLIALFLGVGFIIFRCACFKEVEVVGHGFGMFPVLDLLVGVGLVDGCEEVHIDGLADGAGLDTGLDAAEGQPFLIVRPTLELVDKLVVLHYFDMIDFVFVLVILIWSRLLIERRLE
jgi:hypothetical protein